MTRPDPTDPTDRPPNLDRFQLCSLRHSVPHAGGAARMDSYPRRPSGFGSRRLGLSLGSLGVEWGCAPLWGWSGALPHSGGDPTMGVGVRAGLQGQLSTPPHTPAPNRLRAPDPLRGEGHVGEPPSRGVPCRAFATSERPGRFRSREGSLRAPRQAPGRHTGPSGSVCRPGRLAPSHRYPAVAGAQAFGENPFRASGPRAPCHRPPPRPSLRGAEAVGVGGVGVGL